MSDWSKMSKAKQQAAQMAVHVENYLTAHGKKHITMTEATTAIYGTSGTGNPNAKRIIEGCAAYGYLLITPHGKRVRYVERTMLPIPEEAMSTIERQADIQRMKDEVQRDLDYSVERAIKAVEAAPVGQKSAAMFQGMRDILNIPTRRR